MKRDTSTIRPRHSRLNRFGVVDFVLSAILILFGLMILYPFWNVILVSVTPTTVYAQHRGMMLWPPKIIWDAYKTTFRSSLIWSGYRNTIIITFLGTAYNMALTILAAYALTKDFIGNRVVRFLIIFPLYFSGGLIPYYLLIQDLRLINTIWVLFLPTGVNIMYLLIISNYFASLPDALEDSARIDGASDFRILFQIILPLSLPLLATFTLYYAVERWNEWYNAMLFVKSVSLWPLQNVLRTIINDVTVMASQNIPGQVRPDIASDNIKMSSIIVSMLPMMMLYPFLQRYFLSGLTLGAVKE
ncbi:MAG: carbohydrate ABC transporter permease [Bacillota bacterium]|nr:carbohydrate ABC transporter permease [Bacillota bacterium]